MSPQDPTKNIAGYEVTVRGQYQSISGKDRVLKNYGPVTFFLPEYVEMPNGKKRVNKTVDGRVVQTWEPQFKKSAVTIDGVALYIVQRRLLPTWLGEKYPDAAQFRTCSIVPGGMKRVMRPAKDAVILNKPVAEMSKHELAAYCKMHGLDVQVMAYADAAEAAEAVQFAIDEKKSGGAEPARPDETDAAAGPGDGAAIDGQEAADLLS